MLLQSQFGVFAKATVLCLLEELKDDFFADARPHKIIFLRLHLNTFYHPRTSLSAVLSWKLSTEIFSVRLTSLKVNKKKFKKSFSFIEADSSLLERIQLEFFRTFYYYHNFSSYPSCSTKKKNFVLISYGLEDCRTLSSLQKKKSW